MGNALLPILPDNRGFDRHNYSLFQGWAGKNEFCVWITSQPLDMEEAKEALRRAVPDFDTYLENEQIELIPHTHWYFKECSFDPKRVLNGLVEKLNQALANGYDGLRLTECTFWLKYEDWNVVANYEEEVDRSVYPLQIRGRIFPTRNYVTILSYSF